VVEQQQLGDGQWRVALAAGDPAQARGWVGAGAQPGPDGLLDHLAVRIDRVPVDVQRVDRTAVRVPGELEVDGGPRAVVPDVLGHDAVQVRMPDGRPQQQLGGQRRAGRNDPAGQRREPDDDIGERPLRPDERRGFRLALVQLREHRRGRVAALGGVPLDLPAAPDLLGRVQVHGGVEAGAGELGVQRQQPLGNDELPRLDQHRPPQLPGVVIVDRLEHRLAHGEQLQVLFHDLQVVTVRVQGRERLVPAFGPVVPVVVVDADRGAAIRPERLDQAPGDRRLPGGAVARDGEHDRARDVPRGLAGLLHPEQLVRHAITVSRAPAGLPPPHGGDMQGIFPRSGSTFTRIL
jgi:hypothetical protein